MVEKRLVAWGDASHLLAVAGRGQRLEQEPTALIGQLMSRRPLLGSPHIVSLTVPVV